MSPIVERSDMGGPISPKYKEKYKKSTRKKLKKISDFMKS